MCRNLNLFIFIKNILNELKFRIQNSSFPVPVAFKLVTA